MWQPYWERKEGEGYEHEQRERKIDQDFFLERHQKDVLYLIHIKKHNWWYKRKITWHTNIKKIKLYRKVIWPFSLFNCSSSTRLLKIHWKGRRERKKTWDMIIRIKANADEWLAFSLVRAVQHSAFGRSLWFRRIRLAVADKWMKFCTKMLVGLYLLFRIST